MKVIRTKKANIFKIQSSKKADYGIYVDKPFCNCPSSYFKRKREGEYVSILLLLKRALEKN